MNIIEIIVFVGFVFIIVRYILDIKELVIHTKKRKIEILRENLPSEKIRIQHK